MSYRPARRLIGLDGIASIYGDCGRTLATRISAQPDFPKRVTWTDGAKPLWWEDEVIAYFEARQEAA